MCRYMQPSVKAAASTVLVVDDDPQERSNLSEIIASLGYAVETAVDGEDALAKIDVKPVAAILTDLMMPRMDGFQLLRSLMERRELTPAIVLTDLCAHKSTRKASSQ